jgi:uncharacterized protein YgbK (DUF1537 family)
LAAQTQAPIVVVTREEREGARPEFFRRETIYVFDSQTEEELANVARVLAKEGLLNAVAAPAALARRFPSVLHFQRTSAQEETPSGPMLTVIGSVNEVSREQAVRAAGRGFKTFFVPSELLLEGSEHPSARAGRLISDVTAALASHLPVILQTSRHAADVQAVLEAGGRSGLAANELHERINSNLARLVRRILGGVPVAALTVFGGDTLVAIATACGWEGFLPHRELRPGVAQAQVVSNLGPRSQPAAPRGNHAHESTRQLHIFSKPGGFGTANVLVQIRSALGG